MIIQEEVDLIIVKVEEDARKMDVVEIMEKIKEKKIEETEKEKTRIIIGLVNSVPKEKIDS